MHHLIHLALCIARVVSMIFLLFRRSSCYFEHLSVISNASPLFVRALPPLSFCPSPFVISSEARNPVVPGRAKDLMTPPLSFRSEARNLVVPGRAKDLMTPPLSFRSEARNLVVPGRAKNLMTPPLSFRSEATNLVFPGRAKDLMTPPLSFRSEARNLVFPTENLFLLKEIQRHCGIDGYL